jgi:hypothetical protein
MLSRRVKIRTSARGITFDDQQVGDGPRCDPAGVGEAEGRGGASSRSGSAKKPAQEVSVTWRDLQGIRAYGNRGVLVVLVFPSPSPSWALVRAGKVSARTWKVCHLLALEEVDVGFNVDHLFCEMVADLDLTSVIGDTRFAG